MNTNTLQKYYDRLTPKERLAALLDAGLRGDEQEHRALLESAPKFGYSVPHHYFLATAYSEIAAVHMCTLLGMGCAFYQGQMVLHMLDEEDSKESFDNLYGLFVSLAKAFKIVDASWKEFCKGEGMDPDKMLVNLPGSGVYDPDDPNMGMTKDTLPHLRGAMDIISPEDPDSASVAELVDTLKATLKRLSG